LGENRYELSGRVELDELAELTNLELDYPEYKTVSFLIIEKLGHLPRVNEALQLEAWQLKVTKMLRNTILKVELTRSVSEPQSESQS
jgi:putative hemolysin